MNTPAPDRPNYRVLISRFLSSRQWDRALEAAMEWLAREPENGRAHLAAAQALVNLKRYNEAEPHLFEALKSNPNSDSAWRFLSIVQFHQKRYKAADESVQKAISLNPRDAFHWYHLAWMLYKQGDAPAGRRYAEKARELAPRNAAVLNLLVLCTPRTHANAGQILEKYHDALELDPQNPQIHNNIGIHYLNVERDYAAAEQCFRRALFFDPTMKVARANLFLALKRRDIVYRVLCAPRDWVFRLFAAVRARRKWILLYVLIVPLWILVFRYVVAVLGLWFLFVWPMVKAYEYLTLGDLRAQAGDIGARRGGIFGYRCWQLKLRLGFFALLLAAFWGGIALLIVKSSLLKPDEFTDSVLAPLVILGLFVLLGFWLRVKLKRGHRLFWRPKRSAQIDRLLKQKSARANPTVEQKS